MNSNGPDRRDVQEKVKNLETAYKEKFDEKELAGEQEKLDARISVIQDLMNDPDPEVQQVLQIELQKVFDQLGVNAGHLMGLIFTESQPQISGISSIENESSLISKNGKTEFHDYKKSLDALKISPEQKQLFEYFGIGEMTLMGLFHAQEIAAEGGLDLSFAKTLEKFKEFIDTELVGIEKHGNLLSNVKKFIGEKFVNLSQNLDLGENRNRFIVNAKLTKDLQLDEIRDLLGTTKFYLNQENARNILEKRILEKYGTKTEWISKCNKDFDTESAKIRKNNTHPQTGRLSNSGKYQISKLYNLAESRKKAPDRERKEFDFTVKGIKDVWGDGNYTGETSKYLSYSRSEDETREDYAMRFIENEDLGKGVSQLTEVSFLKEADQETETEVMLNYLIYTGAQLLPVVGDSAGLIVDIPDIFSEEDTTLKYLKSSGLAPEDYEMEKFGYENILAIAGTFGAIVGLNELSKIPKVMRIVNNLSKIPMSMISKIAAGNPQLGKAFELFKAFSKPNGAEAKKLEKGIEAANQKTLEYIEKVVAKNPNLDRATLIKNMDANVTNPERIARTEELLGGIKLSPEQQSALLKAHGMDLGKNFEKGKILMSGGFSKAETRKIMDAGLAGGTDVLMVKPLKEVLTGTIADGLSIEQLEKLESAHKCLLNAQKSGATEAQVSRSLRYAKGYVNQSNLNPATRTFLEESILGKDLDVLAKTELPKVEKVVDIVEEVVHPVAMNVFLKGKIDGLNEPQLTKIQDAHKSLLNAQKSGKTEQEIAKANRWAKSYLDEARLDPTTRTFLEENVLGKSADELGKVEFPKVKVEISVEKVVEVKSPEILLENEWGLSEAQLAKVNGAHNLLLNSKKPGKTPEEISRAKRYANGALDQANLDPNTRKLLEENVLGKRADEITPLVREEGVTRVSKTDDVLEGEELKKAEKALHRQKCIDYIQSAEVQHEIEKIFDGCDNIPLDVRKKLTDHINKQALQQEIDNPEQYVGHGFGHSLNVKKQVENILDTNPQIVERMSEMYGISPEKSRMLSQLVAIYHDFGYPEVGKDANGKSLGKALHAITGAEILKQDEFIKIFDECFTEIPDKLRKNMLSDLADGVLFHSADKVEIARDAKIKIAHGEFIIDKENVVSVYNKFGGVHKDGGISIEASAEHIAEIKEIIKHEGISESRFKFIETNSDRFSGRKVDLGEKDDEILGVEYRSADAMEDPLLFLVRLADNTDMTPNRFSAIQRTEAFQDVYHFFGEGDSGKLFAYLEPVVKKVKKGKQNLQDALEETLSFIQSDPNLKTLCKKFEIDLPSVTSVDDIFGKIKKGIIDGVISDPKNADDIQKFGETKMREILEAQNSISFRHFGGCESVKNVELVNGELVVKVDMQKYKKLNKTIITEEIKVGEVAKEIEVGVGEYQVFRFMDANNSLTNGGAKVRIRVQDDKTSEILTSDFKTEFYKRNGITS
jgi:hypothetical protein